MKKLTTMLLLLGGGLCFGQSLELQTITSGGEHSLKSSSGESLDMTIGEIATERLESSDAVLTQGFHQVFEMGTTWVDDEQDLLEIAVYPNPTRGDVQIKASTLEGLKDVFVYDNYGRLILRSDFRGLETRISLGKLSSGSYKILVVDTKGKSQSHTTINKL